MRISIALLVLSPLAYCAFADALSTQSVGVPMRDGISLRTDIYLPVSGGPTYPVILLRCPYPRGMFKGEAEKLVQKGYAVVVQDVRGTGDSGGIFTAFLDDGWGANRDGADTVDWIGDQAWCNGKIGTLGASAGANTQTLLAPATSKLSCQVMEAAASDFYRDLAYPGGVWRPEQTDTWFKLFKEAGEPARLTLRAHPTYDTLWEGLNAAAKSNEITAPGMHIGGWFDIFKEGTLRAFISRHYDGGQGAKGNQKLIMKWTGHGEYLRDLSLKFPDNVFDVKISKFRDRFLDHWLKGIDNGIDKEPAVHYYVIGDDTSAGAPGMEWRTASRWPPFPPHTKALYLYGEELQDVPPRQFVARTFTYDPADPCPTKGGCNLTIPSGPYDQRELLTRKDVLLFTGPVLAEPLETTGGVRAKLFVSSTAPDTDFTAKLLDIYPAGDNRHILITESIQRVKFRNGFEQPASPLTPDEVVPLEIDLGSTSWIFNKGHRVGLLVSSSNYPHFEINPNTGQDFPVKNETRKADNTIHMNPNAQSALFLPVRIPELDSDNDGVTDEIEWDKGTDMNNANSK